jgi:hypothetical protein
VGILGDEERVELLEGVLVEMPPIGDEHAACVMRLNELLAAHLAGRALIAIQGPIALPRSRPYPDVACSAGARITTGPASQDRPTSSLLSRWPTHRCAGTAT